MAVSKINIKEIRKRAATKGIYSIAELARQVGCRRETIYFAVKRPRVFPIAFKNIMEAVGE